MNKDILFVNIIEKHISNVSCEEVMTGRCHIIMIVILYTLNYEKAWEFQMKPNKPCIK